MSRQPPSPLAIWQEFHWAFFLDVQGLIICFLRFETFLKGGRWEAAEKELVTASRLMTSSSAAMELAAAFPRETYENTVRVSMTPPSVASENFSGLMSWEHAELLTIWRRLSPSFATLPNELKHAHTEFVSAYKNLANSHTGICARFVGEDTGSLRYGDRSAVETLRRFGRNRLDLISPDDKR